jgi:hypothetical protein
MVDQLWLWFIPKGDDFQFGSTSARFCLASKDDGAKTNLKALTCWKGCSILSERLHQSPLPMNS